MSTRNLVIFAAISAVSSSLAKEYTAENLKALFDEFKTNHKRVYETMDEEVHRFNVFVDTLKLIQDRNAGASSEVHGITRFADLTQNEFESMFLDRHIASKIRSTNATVTKVQPYEGSATAIDYTGTQTTAVKDQGNCGSCWAHACAEQIESDGMRQFGNSASLTLSVQQLVSCDDGPEQLGCMGGLQETGFDYVRENGGIVTSEDYPYTARTGRCNTSKDNYVMGVTGYEMILRDTYEQTEADYTAYMLSTGTISIGVDATTWNTYKSGVMSDCGKGTDINHSVQLVGVDTVNDGGYWKIRNSWSEDFGEDGFIRIEYGSNTCGLVTEGGSHTTVFNI